MQDSLFCSHCKTTLEEFLQTGLIGCVFCYTAFKENLLLAIEKTQGKTEHVGKRPPWTARQRHIFSKKLELRNAFIEAMKRKDKELADSIYATLKRIDTLEGMYELQMQLTREIPELVALEELKKSSSPELSAVYPHKESSSLKEKLYKLEYEIQELEKEICN